jgi:hypothetical protein
MGSWDLLKHGQHYKLYSVDSSDSVGLRLIRRVAVVNRDGEPELPQISCLRREPLLWTRVEGDVAMDRDNTSQVPVQLLLIFINKRK